MTEDLDPTLERLFARAAEEPLGAGFTAAVLERIERDSRARFRRRIAVIAILSLVVLWQLPAILSASANAATRLLGAASPAAPDALAAWVISPAGWTVSLLVGAAVLWRSRPHRAVAR